jgi:hypothetical protein
MTPLGIKRCLKVDYEPEFTGNRKTAVEINEINTAQVSLPILS